MALASVMSVGVDNTRANELTVPAFQTYSFAVASADPFADPYTAPAQQSPEPFGLRASSLVTGGIQRKWRAVQKRLFHERNVLKQCREDAAGCPAPAAKFLAILDKAQSREGWARIAEINRAINLDIKPVDDMTQYGVVDFWATPLMAFASNAGDCEDYAIAKYVALHEIGFASDDLRLLVVHDHATREDHAVAAVRYDGHWLILDNRTLDMRRDADVAELDPLFVIDGDGVKSATIGPFEPPLARVDRMPAAMESRLSAGAETLLLLSVIFGYQFGQSNG